LNPEIANHNVLTNDKKTAVSHFSEEVNGTPAFFMERYSLRPGDLVLAVWRGRRFVVKAGFYGLILAALFSLTIAPKYQSETRIMPPQKMGSMGGLAAMLASAGEDKGGAPGAAVGSLLSDAMGVKSPGALYIGVLHSSSVQDAMIEKFNLKKLYRVTYLKDARDVLADNTDVSEDRKSGIITLVVTDPSPQRAQEMAAAYVSTLDTLMAQLDTSAAHRERVFLETRLTQVKADLDSASKDLSDFSSKNGTLDVKDQGKAMVEGAASLAGQLIAAESQLDGLRQIYTDNNVRIRSLQARVDLLRQKLSELRGTDAAAADASSGANADTDTNANGGGDFGMSISKLPVVGLTYYDLYRRMKMQETVYEVLTKQFEIAKIEEAKELPTSKVLDPANFPEAKTSPKRRLITLAGGFLCAFLAAAYLAFAPVLRAASTSGPLGLFGLELREGLDSDWALIRKRIPEPVLAFAVKVRERLVRFVSPPPDSNQ
jgi:capsule polysaccharide export protein KpsE/RkpR